MNESAATELLRRALKRLKLINGPDAKCVHDNPERCENHQLIHEIEKYLTLRPLRAEFVKFEPKTEKQPEDEGPVIVEPD